MDCYFCGDFKTVIQRTANDFDTGIVTISNNFSFIEVTYSISGNWILDKTRLYIGAEANIPLNNNGTPKISQLPYQTMHPWGADTCKLKIPRGVLNGTIVVIAPADVLKVNKITCGILDSQCSTGIGNPFTNSNGCTTQKVYYDLQAFTDY